MRSTATILLLILLTLPARLIGQDDPAFQRPADELRITGQYQHAIEAYQAALESDNTTRAAVGIARCRLETGQYDQAIEVLNAHKPSESDAPWHLAMADVLIARGQYTDALAQARSAVAADPQSCAARLTQADLLETLGKREDAVHAYAWFEDRFLNPLPDVADELTAAGVGFLRYSALTRHPALTDRTKFVLADVFQKAYERLDRTCWPARIAAADLLSSKSKYEDAAEDYLAALRINENLAAAHIGLAAAAVDLWGFEQAESQINAALHINPNAAEAKRLLANLRLTERRYDEALHAANESLAINPNHIAAMGSAAAAHYAMNHPDHVDRLRRRAESVTPRPSTFHITLGDTHSALRQYAASETEYLKAIEYDPTDPHPRTELGLMYMQWGEEEKAHVTLTAAFALDPFDARTHNVLDLLNTIRDLNRVETDHFIIRYADRDAVLIPYLAGYLESIHDELTDDYNVTLHHKTIIELFPEHRQFAVRITGKPWIPTVGACTGRVIALEAPRTSARLEGPYHIARVLRHEFTHTVTLAATENRIPHWFTEGLAVLQEDAPKPFYWRQMLAESVRRGNLFTLQSIDWGFIRPQQPNDRSRAYAQSEWMCEFIIDRFGYDAIPEMLDLYKARKSQPEVLAEVTGLTPEAVDAAFAEWARSDAADWCFDLTPPENPESLRAATDKNPEDPNLWARLAKAHLDAGDLRDAIAAATSGTNLDENHIPSLTVLGQSLWRLREAQDDDSLKDELDRQIQPRMKRLADLDPDGWLAPKLLATFAVDNEDYDVAKPMLQRLKSACPHDPYADRLLAGLDLAQQNLSGALPHLLNVAAADENDPAIAKAIADIHRDQDRLHDARYWYKQSIFINAYELSPHESLLDVCRRLNDPDCVARESAALATIRPNNLTFLEQAARAHAAIDDTAAAADFARRAAAINPDTPVKALIVNSPE